MDVLDMNDCLSLSLITMGFCWMSLDELLTNTFAGLTGLEKWVLGLEVTSGESTIVVTEDKDSAGWLEPVGTGGLFLGELIGWV